MRDTVTCRVNPFLYVAHYEVRLNRLFGRGGNGYLCIQCHD